MNKNAPIDKNKSDDRGKAKVEEIREQYKKKWVENGDSYVVNETAPDSGVGTSSGN